MDHPSSMSTTSTATNLRFSEAQDASQNDDPRCTYTTAGTIYDPNSNKPLQAPTRRARTLKWPLTSGPNSELSLFPKSALSALGLKGLSRTKSSPLPEYSPLQQNNERAVQPSKTTTTEDTMTPPSASSSTMETNMPSPQFCNDDTIADASAFTSQPEIGKSDSVEKPAITDAHVGKEVQEEPLRGFTVKSLHNLASYPNPNQKRAQLALLCTQPQDSSRFNNGEVGKTKASSSSGASFPAESEKNGESVPSTYFKRPDAVERIGIGRASMNHEDISSLGASHGHLMHGDGLNSRAVTQTANRAYRSTLATGPGAPRPLTAGPPGHRQYRPSTFDTTLRALHSSDNSRLSSHRDVTPAQHGIQMDLQRPAHHDHQLPGQTSQQVSSAPQLLHQTTDSQLSHKTLMLRQLINTSVPDDTGYFVNAPRTSRESSSKISMVDTKYHSEILKYYPFRQTTIDEHVDLAVDWEKEYPLNHRKHFKPGTFELTDEELEVHNNRVERLFYANIGEVGKDMSRVIQDTDYRQFTKRVGGIGVKHPRPEASQVKKVSVKEVSAMSTSEVANPLLAMVFAKLNRILEEEDEDDKHQQFEQRHTRHNDGADAGAHIFFGNSNEGSN